MRVSREGIASQWDPADREILPRPTILTRRHLSAAASLDQGSEAVAALLTILEGEWPIDSSHHSNAIAAGLMLEVMLTIEDAFTAVHPRTRMVPPTLGGIPDPPDWADDAQRRRLRYGSYAEFADRRWGQYPWLGLFARCGTLQEFASKSLGRE
jgi:hypothetical protein